jgi:hypothetical protein
MELSHLYARKLRAALKDAVDTRKVAEAWAALHPADFQASKSGAGQDSNLRPLERPSSGTSAPRDHATKAIPSALAAFLARFGQAIAQALRSVLGDLWPEAWVLGQQAAQALAADLPETDWAGWSPGDVEAAFQVAGGGLRDLLSSQEVQIKSIASSRLEELGDILAEYISSDVSERPYLPEPLPPQYSVQQLADALEDVLDNPDRAFMVAQTEVARAQSVAAMETFRALGIGQVEVSTAADARVCERCENAEAAGAQPLGTYTVPLHPLCRCALIPVLPKGAGLAALAGVTP